MGTHVPTLVYSKNAMGLDSCDNPETQKEQQSQKKEAILQCMEAEAVAECRLCWQF